MNALVGVLCASVTLAACDVSRPSRVGFDAGTGCPQFPSDLSVDSSCDGRRCALSTRQDGCRLELSISECMVETLTATIGPGGELGFQPARTLGRCASTPPRSLAAFAIECSTTQARCRYDLYAPAPRSDLTLQEVSFVSSPFDRPPGQESEPLAALSPLAGYLADSLVLNDAVWVATRAGTFGTVECAEPERAELVRVDPETLQITARETAPPCLAALARDPSALGAFLGATAGPAPALYRFDAQGRVIDALLLPSPLPSSDLIPTGLATDSSTTVALLLSQPAALGSTWLLTVNAQTLMHAATSAAVPSRLRASSGLIGARIYAADEGAGQVVPFDVPTAAALSRISLMPIQGSAREAGFLYFHPPTQKLMVATTGRRGALWTVDPAQPSADKARAVAYEAELVPWAITAWPGSSDILAVGMMVEPLSYAATIARFSVSENRFLPGSTRIGQGLVRRLDPDARGRLWALLPWSGRLVRITPGS